jgi:cytoskeletal protein RodZ
LIAEKDRRRKERRCNMKTKGILAVAVGVSLVLGILGLASAQQAPPAKQPEKPTAEKAAPAKAPAKRVTGSVKSASEESLILEVVQKDKSTKEYTFALDPKAKLSRAGKAITVKDLKQGDSLTVSFTETNGKLVANTVSVRAKKGG